MVTAGSVWAGQDDAGTGELAEALGVAALDDAAGVDGAAVGRL